MKNDIKKNDPLPETLVGINQIAEFAERYLIHHLQEIHSLQKPDDFLPRTIDTPLQVAARARSIITSFAENSRVGLPMDEEVRRLAAKGFSIERKALETLLQKFGEIETAGRVYSWEYDRAAQALANQHFVLSETLLRQGFFQLSKNTLTEEQRNGLEENLKRHLHYMGDDDLGKKTIKRLNGQIGSQLRQKQLNHALTVLSTTNSPQDSQNPPSFVDRIKGPPPTLLIDSQTEITGLEKINDFICDYLARISEHNQSHAAREILTGMQLYRFTETPLTSETAADEKADQSYRMRSADLQKIAELFDDVYRTGMVYSVFGEEEKTNRCFTLATALLQQTVLQLSAPTMAPQQKLAVEQKMKQQILNKSGTASSPAEDDIESLLKNISSTLKKSGVDGLAKKYAPERYLKRKQKGSKDAPPSL